MGFWNGLGRIVQGKPVFENPDTPPTAQTTPATSSAAPEPQPKTDRYGSPLDARGYKIIPDIAITHVKARRNGADQSVTAWVANRSDQPVRIDYVRLLSQKATINRELAPGQSHEITLYRGRTPLNDHDEDAELVFRLMSNTDQFQRRYDVEFHREADGSYLVEELHDNGPVRDI